MKEKSKLNYIKVLILFVVTILIVVLLANIYNDKKNYERANGDVMSFLATVKYEEMDEYLVENTDGFIYISSSADEYLESFEMELKEYLLNEEIEEDFAYLDSGNNPDKIYKNLKKSYIDENLSKQITFGSSNVLALDDGKIVAILSMDSNALNLEDVKNFVSSHGVLND